MANMDGDIEIVDNTVEEVLSESVRKTESGVGSVYEDQGKRSEKRGGDEVCSGIGEKLEIRMVMYEKELVKLKGGNSGRKAELEAV